MVKSTASGRKERKKKSEKKADKPRDPKAAAPAKAPLKEPEAHAVWAEIVLEGTRWPQQGVGYRILLGGKPIAEGETDRDGLVRKDGVKSGDYQIALTRASGLQAKDLPAPTSISSVVKTTQESLKLIPIPKSRCVAQEYYAKCMHSRKADASTALEVTGHASWFNPTVAVKKKAKSFALKVGTDDVEDEKVEISYGPILGMKLPDDGCGKSHAIVVKCGDVEVARGTEKVTFDARYSPWFKGSMGGFFTKKPAEYTATVEGCGGYRKSFTIRAYPTRQTSVSIEVEGEALESLEKFNAEAQRWSKKLGQIINVEFKILPPTGSIEASWGYKEHGDARAFFAWSVEAGMKPLIGAKAKVDFSFFSWLPDFLRDHLADVRAFAELKGEINVVGSIEQSAPGSLPGGKVGPEGTLGLSIGIEASAGSEWVAKVVIRGAASTKVFANGALEFEPPSIDLVATVGWGGIKFAVEYELTGALVIDTEGTITELQLVDGGSHELGRTRLYG